MTDKYNPTVLAEQLREWAETLEGNVPSNRSEWMVVPGIVAGMREVADDLFPEMTTTRIVVKRWYDEDAEFVNGRTEATPMHRWWTQVRDEFNEAAAEWAPEGESCVELLETDTTIDDKNEWVVYFDVEVTYPKGRRGQSAIERIGELFFNEGVTVGDFTLYETEKP